MIEILLCNPWTRIEIEEMLAICKEAEECLNAYHKRLVKEAEECLSLDEEHRSKISKP